MLVLQYLLLSVTDPAARLKSAGVSDVRNPPHLLKLDCICGVCGLEMSWEHAFVREHGLQVFCFPDGILFDFCVGGANVDSLG